MEKQASPTIRKFTFEEVRFEIQRYWSKRTVHERLAAMEEINLRLNKLRGLDVEAMNADWTISRVPRERD